MIDHVVILALEHFLSVYFLSWCNLDNVGGLWNFDNVDSLWCWMNFGLDFGSIGIMKNLCCWLVWIFSWCMWEILLACVNFISWTWQILWVNLWVWKIFVDIEKILWAWNFGYGKILLGMWFLIMENFVARILDMWEFICAWTRTCGNFIFDGYLGHVGNFLLCMVIGNK